MGKFQGREISVKYFKQHASPGGYTCCCCPQTDLPAFRETSSLRETPPCAAPVPGSAAAGPALGQAGREAGGAERPGRAERAQSAAPGRLRCRGTALPSAPGLPAWPGSRSPSAPSAPPAPPAASTATGTGKGSAPYETASSPGSEVPRAGRGRAGGGEARAIPDSDRPGGKALVRGSGTGAGTPAESAGLSSLP